MEVKDDLRLNLGLGEATDAASLARCRHLHHRAVVDIGPDGLAHAVERPHVGIGEANLASNRHCTALHAGAMNQIGDGITTINVEVAER